MARRSTTANCQSMLGRTEIFSQEGSIFVDAKVDAKVIPGIRSPRNGLPAASAAHRRRSWT